VDARQLQGALGNGNRLKLGTFSTNLQHGGFATRLPGTLRADWQQVKYIACLTDALGLELIVPVARWKGYGGEIGYAEASFDTFCWAAGLLAATRNVHVFSTVHVSTIHPLVAAKQLMTNDHLSGGRSGLNVVGGWFRPELEMFGPDYLLEHSKRYDLAEEWTKVVSLFWSSTEEFDFRGEFFDIRGGTMMPKPLQAPRPPIMNAGGSQRGQRFAAQHSDMIFVHVQDDEDLLGARSQVEAIKTLARDEFGREVQVWTQSYVVCRDTDEDARAFWRHYVRDLGDFEAADNLMHFLGLESEVLGDNWERARERFISGWGGTEMVGTAETIASRFNDLAEAGFDGTVLLFPQWEIGLQQFGAEILPLLEQAGLRSPVR
jgi:alkanesulfonate monooxygenase SsuD/methylene tetrahydromethanopterin reductase-like flavin-dependent oxidoreductase (luciferase family)